MTEEAHHHEAFEKYYAMGAGRSLATLAKSLGVAANTAKTWSVKFRWRERIAERERKVSEAVATRAIKSEADVRTRSKQIVQLALIRIAQAVADGSMKGTFSDLDRLVRLEGFLDGEADSRPEIVARDLRGKSMEELREILRTEIAELRRLEELVSAHPSPSAN